MFRLVDSHCIRKERDTETEEEHFTCELMTNLLSCESLHFKVQLYCVRAPEPGQTFLKAAEASNHPPDIQMAILEAVELNWTQRHIQQSTRP